MMRLAMPASRSLIALLVGTVAFFALYIVALKPSGSGKSSTQSGLGAYTSAINKAHQAVTTSGTNDAASGNVAAAGSTSTSGAAAKPATSTATAPATQPATAKPIAKSVSPTVRLSTVQHALKADKVVALLFLNPAAADDRAVKQELASVPSHRGQVVKLTVPLSEAVNFTAVTQQVPLNFSPTLVLIAPSGHAAEIIGFSDRFEIAQRVNDALAAK
jgi:hypothetical protein